MTRRFFIRTYGCQMNEHDSERLAGLLVADGLEPTSEIDEADVVVFNTCCIRENADEKFYGQLSRLKAKREANPDMVIAVGGCLAQKDRERVRERAGHVDVVFGTHNVTAAPSLIARSLNEGPIVSILDAPDPLGAGDELAAIGAVRELPYAAWITLQTGCDNSCAFCIVPAVRGPEQSRPFELIVAEAERLAAAGVVEVTLLGQNVNSYGRDLTKRRPLFADLLRAVGAIDGIERIRFTSPHPKDLRPETIAAMVETTAVTNQLHLPLQSGSNRVLSAMRRGYTAERYLEKLASARAAISDLAVTTDIIVGFPGESEEEFEATLEVAAEADFDSTFTFIFSPRPGTRAAAMTDDFLAEDVISERFARLHAVTERTALRQHVRRIGRVESVLVEGLSKRDATMTSGRTNQGKLIHFQAPDQSVLRPGTFCDVQVTTAASHHMLGTFQRVTALPRHKTRLAVAAR